MYKIYPNVKKAALGVGDFTVKEKFTVFFNKEAENVFTYQDNLDMFNPFPFLDLSADFGEKADIIITYDNSLNEEAYKLSVNEKTNISFKTKSGIFYALKTFEQILKQTKEKITYIDIYDEADIKIRGLMLDISRNKVPKLETIEKIVDMMANLKMNHLELYVEGFSFEYKSFEKYLEIDGFITLEEYKELEKYASDRCIDLVPNQNGFGHMTKWLETDEFKDLAECPGGIYLWKRNRPASTLDPTDERSIKLIEKMYSDMLPYSESKYFNMNFDEPFELGKGKSKEICEKEGLGNVYIDYVLRAYEIIKKYNKTPMMWGDVLINHPELLKRLPEDMIFIDWGYDASHPFDRNLKMLSDLNIKFMAAPGTTSWSSFTSRTSDWRENITNACMAVKKYDGHGVILTDWGDFGHLQFLPISYAPICYMGLYSWRMKEATYLSLKDYLNNYIFLDKSGIMAEAILDLGNYYRFENNYGVNGTPTFYNFMWASLSSKEDEKIDYFYSRIKDTVLNYKRFRLLRRFFNLKIEEIGMNEMDCEDAKLIESELYQAIKFIKMTQKINIAFNEEVELEKRIRYLEEVVASKDMIIDEQSRLWHERNKSGGFKESITLVNNFFDFASYLLEFLGRRGESYEI